MARTRIKFCGITRVEDAIAAAKLGADAIGLVLHSTSPRTITRETARQILAALQAYVTPVGLFVDAPMDQVLETANDLGLRHVQLQGHESPQDVAKLTGKIVIKAVHVTREGLGGKLQPWHGVPNVGALLLETGSAPHAGGSGIENDWKLIRTHQQAGDFEGLAPIVAAGGLTPENVASVVRLIRPWAVDVSSGIESAKGIKSREKMQAFAAAVREADAAPSA